MGEPILNLAAWIDRRRKDVGPYADHIIHSVQAYEARITALEAENARLREALERILICGNHLVAHLPHDYPPYGTEPSTALQEIGSGLSYDLWCCWAAMMVSRAALSQTGEVK